MRNKQDTRKSPGPGNQQRNSERNNKGGGGKTLKKKARRGKNKNPNKSTSQVSKTQLLKKELQEKDSLELQTTDVPDVIRLNPDLFKYFKNRKELFTKYNKGIKLDAESWYSVTPERIAAGIAWKCKGYGQSEDLVVLDAFCGCGGNTIQFAKRFKKVIAVDIDPVKIEYCKHNAGIYGVSEKIEFVVGDFTKLAGTLKADVVFLAPPWGGVDYMKYKKFDIEKMTPLNGVTLFRLAQCISPNIVYNLPRNVDKSQVDALAGGGMVSVIDNILRTRRKGITAYYGNLVLEPSTETISVPIVTATLNDQDEVDTSEAAFTQQQQQLA